MQVSTRSYLTGGMSFVAVGAIIAMPTSSPAPLQGPRPPLVGNQQVQLAASVSPTTVHRVADKPAAVHVLIEVSGAF
jgi:hypothetical protein